MLKIGAAQFDARSGDFDFNVAAHVRLIERAAARGVSLVLFPELSVSGYAKDLLDSSPDDCVVDPDGARLAPIREACRVHRVASVVGASLRSDSGMTLSSIVVDRRGEVCARYDKQNLDESERVWFVAGRDGGMIEIDGRRLGLSICYDASFPEHARAAACSGADAYLIAGAFPVGASARRRAIFVPARAMENTVYTVFSNYSGAHAGWSFCGGSAVHGPDGAELATVGTDETGLAVAELNAEALARVRDDQRMLRDLPGETGTPPPIVVD
ncbi:MAG: carbon-nitrogen hydrolase family protein [bacterium]|nr:carbon-nitrogen hydrolase family protein [bacterium]